MMSAQSDDIFDHDAKLKLLLNSTKLEKDATQAKINDISNELQTLFSKMPKKPRETMPQLDEKIRTLEFKRTTTSMSLAEEKLILRDIEKIKIVKSQLDNYNAYENKVQDKKSQLTSLRESLKSTVASIEELEALYREARLATKLGCTPAQLCYRSIDVSSEKIGRVIGKNGANIKQLETQHKVVMDVNSVNGKIHLTGSTQAVESAILDIEKICMAVDVDVTVPTELMTYLTSKRINALADFRSTHSDLQIEASREKGVISIRGDPEAVELCKEELLHFPLKSETRVLVGRESALIVGRSGGTINRLVETYKVNIDVSEKGSDLFMCTIIGPDVEGAVAEIDSIMLANKEMSEEIMVDNIVRNTLLTDGGAPMKQLQKQIVEAVKEVGGGGILLSFKNKAGDNDEKSVLVVKCKHGIMETAIELVSTFLAKIEASLVTIDVDPFVVPMIIGKGGETIKNIKNGKLVNIEVDKVFGRVVIQSQHDSEVKRVEAEIHSILEQNHVVRIQLSSARALLREIMRSNRKDEINASVWIGLDEDSSSIILRGTRENVEKISQVVNQFVDDNYIMEVEISPDDEPTLVTGGKESPIQKFQNEYGVMMNVVRSRFVVLAKGKKEKVEAAVKRLNQFLHGGDGYKVSRISVTESALGVVIGKSGAKRSELEKAHEGVHLYIHRSNRITIRGPEDAVEACRIEILRLVSSVKILQTMNITREEYQILSKPDVVKRATRGIPVVVTLAEESVTLRGLFADVRDAQTMLKEQLTGTYQAIVDLEASQVACVRRACRDPSHFERMESSSNATLKLDLATNAIVITGKRTNVRKAKSLVVDFLEFLIPADFARLEISKPLQATVGDAAALAEISAVSGASVSLDRDLSAILIQSAEPGKLKMATEILKTKIENANKLAFVATFGASEAWLIPLIIGKGGLGVNTLRMESGCNIDVDKVDRTVTVIGDDADRVAKARELLDAMIDDARRKIVFVELPEEAVAAFLGRGGSLIRAFATEHNVECDRMRKSRNKVKITGEEVNVQAAKKAFDAWLAEWEIKQAGTTISIDKSSIPGILGKGGSVVVALQKEFGVTVEINRDDLTLTVKGGTSELRDNVIEKIKLIINEDNERVLARKDKKSVSDPLTTSEDVSTSENQAKPSNGEGQPRGKNALHSSTDDRKDRSVEFARIPVGFAPVESGESKNKKSRNHHKTKAGVGSNRPASQVSSSPRVC